MKQLTCLFIICFAISCSSKNETEKSEKDSPKKAEEEAPTAEETTGVLNGTWVPVKQEFGGAMIPESEFADQRLIMSDSIFTVIAESIDKGVVKYTEDKMDIYCKEGINEGKHFRALYKLENEELTICYNLANDSFYPESFETKDKMMHLLIVFKKEK